MRALVPKLVRCAGVSLVSTIVTLLILGVLVATATMSAGWANVVATTAGTVPSFELNRRWVWGRTGRPALLAEIMPFCALSFAGLALSSLAVSTAASWADAAQLGTTAKTVFVELANLGTFGILWVVQFVLLDRVLFRPDPLLVGQDRAR
jgi:putative flippase GtrA